jgi:predicted Ser/Thr protein kinase
VQDLMSGSLDVAARHSVLLHLDGCDDCRELLTVTAKVASREGSDGTLQLPERLRPPADISLEATVAPRLGETLLASDAALAETIAPLPMSHIRGTTQPGTNGTPFGRYQLLERLGAGAMGVVYRGRDRDLDRDVAVKQLRKPDIALTERLMLEARSMAQVNHPNVVHVYDVGVVAGSTYIAMELVEGQSLRAWQSAKERTLPEIVAAYVAAGRGLAAAHASGIVHRDFKPDNVLVGTDERVRVTDFGLASAKPTPGRPSLTGDVNLTTEGSVLGTPAYMAPEQFAGGNVDSRTDQFNFCVALYEALYGRRPFDGKTFMELGDNVAAGKVRPPPASTRVSGGLHTIVLRGLAVKPGDRFPTMDHLIEQLGRDRARPWRITSITALAIAAALGLGLVADYAVRDRIDGDIRQSFEATGKQIERAAGLQARQFRSLSRLVSQLKAMLDVSSHRDQADFGLATPEQDEQDLADIRATLLSQDWKRLSELGQGSLAVIDYKGRLLYSSAAPTEWLGALGTLPAVKRALDTGKGDCVTMVRYDEPALAKAKVFGDKPPHGVAMMFTRTLDHNGEPGGLFTQFVDGNDLLSGIRLDDTALGLVAMDGTAIGEVPTALVRRAPASGEIADITLDGVVYEVQARPLPDFSGQPIGLVVMARPLSGVLSGLFPGARTVFAIAALGALVLFGATAMRARKIAGA